MRILNQGKGGWINSAEVFGHRITAKKNGTGRLVLSVKNYFMDLVKYDKTIQIAVEP